MSAPPRVLLIGLRSEVVDFSKWPGLTREKLEGGLQQVQEELESKGYDAAWCLTDLGETAADVVRDALAAGPFDCVLIGAGIRRDPDLTALLETVIHVVRGVAPATPLAFNTNPFDTTAAVERCIARPSP